MSGLYLLDVDFDAGLDDLRRLDCDGWTAADCGGSTGWTAADCGGSTGWTAADLTAADLRPDLRRLDCDGWTAADWAGWTAAARAAAIRRRRHAAGLTCFDIRTRGRLRRQM